MQLVVNRDAALEAVAFARNASLRRATVPILGSVRLTATVGSITFAGTDLDLECAKACPAEVSEPGDYVIDADRLFGALQSLPAGSDVSIALEANASRAIIKCGRARFQIPAERGADFPTFAAAPECAAAELGAAELLLLLDATEFAVSREMTRPYITGVHLHEVGGALRAVATNGVALSYAETPCPPSLLGVAGQTIPLKAITLLREMAKEGPVSIRRGENLFHATAGSSRMASKVIDQDFPDYNRVIPADPPHTCHVDREKFILAVKRSQAISDARVPAVRISIVADAMTLSSRGERGEDADDAIDATADGEFEGLFSGKLLAEIASRMAGERLTIRYSDPAAPLTISAPGSPDALAVILGMRMT